MYSRFVVLLGAVAVITVITVTCASMIRPEPVRLIHLPFKIEQASQRSQHGPPLEHGTWRESNKRKHADNNRRQPNATIAIINTTTNFATLLLEDTSCLVYVHNRKNSALSQTIKFRGMTTRYARS